MSSSQKKGCIKLQKEIYGKKPVILTVYDYLDYADMLIESTSDTWTITYSVRIGSTFTKETFMRSLNANVAREIIEDRTADMRAATYMAVVTKRI